MAQGLHESVVREKNVITLSANTTILSHENK